MKVSLSMVKRRALASLRAQAVTNTTEPGNKARSKAKVGTLLVKATFSKESITTIKEMDMEKSYTRRILVKNHKPTTMFPGSMGRDMDMESSCTETVSSLKVTSPTTSRWTRPVQLCRWRFIQWSVGKRCI